MTETQGRQWLMKLLKNEPIKLQPIESHGTGSGIPDIWFRTNTSEGWIELKEVHYPKRKETTIKIPWRAAQLNWLKSYMQLGGHGILLVFFIDTFNTHCAYVFEGSNILKEYTQEQFHMLCSFSTAFTIDRSKDFFRILNNLPPV